MTALADYAEFFAVSLTSGFVYFFSGGLITAGLETGDLLVGGMGVLGLFGSLGVTHELAKEYGEKDDEA
ncbi:hypothetical protein [Halorarum salinum]|uniref:Uncharacterized protein n=1 Tax=Halorarum salinum TaxID=2743089 RepID=A0A7D5LAR5_9EURY|nr:hypothetical protein [Halobaculum salinum]QLG61994.1 hypothetical protein HUG12_09775 [Halobaculum salinum]